MRPEASTGTLQLRCSACGSALLRRATEFACSACGALYPVANGIIDFRSGAGAASTGVTDFSSNWPLAVRDRLAAAGDDDALRRELTSDAQFAWQLFVDIRPGDVVLDLDCRHGGLAHNIAPRVAKVCAVSGDREQLEFVHQRLIAAGLRASVELLAAGERAALPFADDCFDLVFLSGTRHLRPDRLAEVRRVLRPDGRLFLRARNRWANWLRRLGPGLRSRPAGLRGLGGYRALLGGAGLGATEALGLVPDYDSLDAIHPVDVDVPYWQPPSARDPKERLRLSRMCMPAFGILAGGGFRPERCLDRLVAAVLRDLGGRAGDLRITEFNVSRKDKAIMRAVFREEVVHVRVSLNPAASISARNNRAMLDFLDSERVSVCALPRSLAYGVVDGLDYFVESHVAGVAARSGIDGAGSSTHLREVAALLRGLNPGTVPQLTLTGDAYAQRVTRKLEPLRELLDGPAWGRLVAFVGAEVQGVRLGRGLVHGDFGVSNVMVDGAGRIAGLIDWEYGDRDGLPVLDAINYLASSGQLSHPDADFAACMIRLMSACAANGSRSEFLDRYFAEYNLDTDGARAFVLLWWLHVISCRLAGGMRYRPGEIREFVTRVIGECFGLG
ncbi:MAG: methyltransferase domain-containing protein [Gammaproteobacteria bacterium]